MQLLRWMCSLCLVLMTPCCVRPSILPLWIWPPNTGKCQWIQIHKRRHYQLRTLVYMSFRSCHLNAQRPSHFSKIDGVCCGWAGTGLLHCVFWWCTGDWKDFQGSPGQPAENLWTPSLGGTKAEGREVFLWRKWGGIPWQCCVEAWNFRGWEKGPWPTDAKPSILLGVSVNLILPTLHP